MGVLATFDEHAAWAQTHVCDSVVVEHLKAPGAAWGRLDAGAASRVDGSIASVLDSRRFELIQLAERFGTGSVDRIRLSPEAAGWEEHRRDWRRLRACAGPSVYWVLEGTLLVHLRTDGGYVGVLCEAGEWLAIPAGLPYALDAGEMPDVDVLVLSTPDVERGPVTQGDTEAALPSLDAFVATMLELTGNEVAE